MKKTEKRTAASKIPPPTFRVIEETELMSFLLASMPHKNRDNIKSYLKYRQVLVDDQPISQFNYLLLPGQIL